VNQPIDTEQPKKPNLDEGQEANLRGLMPDFEPKGEDIKNAAGNGTQKEPDKETLQIVSLMYAGLFGVAAARLGGHWALSGDELVQLAVPTVAVLDKYMPNAKLGVEVALLAAVAMVIVPRVIVTMQQQPIKGESEVVSDGDKSEHVTA
jgi:hypothetical protein